MSTAVVIASGGMDSATLLAQMRTQGRVLAVGFDYGQRHVTELEYLRGLADDMMLDLRIVRLGALASLLGGSALTDPDVEVPDGHYAQDTMKATVVPNRNAIMLSIATGIAVAEKAERVAIGVHAGDHFIYPDCRPQFIAQMGRAMELATEGFSPSGFRVVAPFVNQTKADIVRIGTTLGVDYAKTWSCYKGGAVHCGRCGTCVERQEAFKLAGVADPTEYADAEFADTVT